jgi:hypothetical protein
MTGELMNLCQEDPRSQKRDLGHPPRSLPKLRWLLGQSAFVDFYGAGGHRARRELGFPEAPSRVA